MSERTASWEFPADLSAPERARHHTADALMAWGFDHLVTDAVLVVSELITNAVTHAHSETRLDLRTSGSNLEIGVHDDSPEEPTPREWHHDDTGGLGLIVVDAIAEWRIETDARGKTVWCTLREVPHGASAPRAVGNSSPN